MLSDKFLNQINLNGLYRHLPDPKYSRQEELYWCQNWTFRPRIYENCVYRIDTYWSGSGGLQIEVTDERYKLFGYNYISMSIPRYVIISIVYIIRYTHMSNSIKSAINIGKIYNCLPDNNLYYEQYLYNDQVKFALKNSDRKNHIDRWIKFTNLIWNHDYSSAYDMIEEYNNMKNI